VMFLRKRDGGREEEEKARGNKSSVVVRLPNDLLTIMTEGLVTASGASLSSPSQSPTHAILPRQVTAVRTGRTLRHSSTLQASLPYGPTFP
jgi:hypothetical protein